jgi:phosphoglycolate phosphatase/pyrophosphatase PpaX
MDGTIGNSLPLCIAAFRKSIEPLAGRIVSDQEIIDTFGPSEEGTIKALIPDHFEQGLEDYLKYYRELHGMCKAPFDGIIDAIKLIKSHDIRLAIVTGKGKRSADISLEAYGISSYFDIVETGSPLGPRKAQGIKDVLERLHISPQESMYIGDTPSDITASRDAGVPVIAAAWAETANREQLQAFHPDEMFTTIEDFKRYVEKICQEQ